MSTVNMSDVYGSGSGIGVKPGINTGQTVNAGSAPPVAGDKKPAFYWLGFVMALVLLRLTLEISGS